VEKRINHRDLAAHCGVSTATVSRVLAGHPRVSKQAQERVRKAAVALGYEADPRLAFLSRLRWAHGRRAEKTKVLVVLDRYTKAAPTHPKFGEINRLARELGYELELVSMEEVKAQARRYSREWWQRGVTGLILSTHAGGELPELDWKHFSVVIVGEEFPAARFYRVGSDWRQGFDMLAEKIGSEGERVGYCFFDYGRAGDALAGKELGRLLQAEMLLQRAEFAAVGRSAGPVLRLKDQGQAGAVQFRAWWARYRPDTVISNTAQAWRWAAQETGSNAARFFMVPKIGPWAANEPPGCGYHLARRLMLALRTLHENLLLDRRGYSALPIKLLTPMEWCLGAEIAKKAATSDADREGIGG
jgi:DNA-binding LacI/PurR family transcriptional regulator